MGVVDTAEVEVTLDDREFAASSKRTNKALESFGDSAKKGSKEASDAIDDIAKSAQIAERSITPLEKRLLSFERASRVGGRSGVERIKARQAEAINEIRRLGGGAADVDRVTAAFDRLIKKQNEAGETKIAAANERLVRGLQERAKAAQIERLTAVERLRIEERLAVASARNRGATAGEIDRISASFSTLKREAREAERQLEAVTRQRDRDAGLRAIENQTRALEKQAAVAGKVGADRLRIERQIAIEAAKSGGASAATLQRISRSFDQLEAAANRTTPSVRSTGEAVAFLAAKAVALGAGLKALILDTSTTAARYETLQVALHQVARANGVASAAVDKQEKALKRLGISTEGARTILSQFLTTGLPTERVTELAGLARDLGVIMGEGTTDAAKRLTRAIVSQETEILRTLGINIKFSDGHERMARQLGKTTEELTDQEKVLANYNAVVGVGPRFLGAYEAAMLTTGKQLTSLSRLTLEAKAAIGEAFLPALGTAVNFLTRLSQSISENSDAWRRLAQAVAGAGGAVAGFIAFRGASLALATLLGVSLNPAIGLVVAGIAGLGALYLATRQKSDVLIESIDIQIESLKRQRVELELSTQRGKEFADSLAAIDRKEQLLETRRKLELINKEISKAVSQSGNLRTRLAGENEIFDPLEGVEEDLKRIATLQQQAGILRITLDKLQAPPPAVESPGGGGISAKLKEDLDKARDLLEKVRLETLTTVERIKAERIAQIRELGTTPAAIDAINQAYVLRLKQFQAEVIGRASKDLSEFQTDATAKTVQRFQEVQAASAALREEQVRLAETAIDQSLRLDQERLQRTRDLELANLKQISGLTVQERTLLAQRQLEIEQQFLEQSEALEAESIKRTTRLAIEENKRRAKVTPAIAAELESINVQLIAQQEQQLRALGERTAVGVLSAQRETAAQQANLLADHNQRVFDNFKRQAEGVFDSLTRSGEGFFKSLSNSLKVSFLTAIKEVVTSRVAAALTQLFSGSTAGVPQASGGFLGRGLRTAGLFGGLAGAVFAGAPGGTSGFAGPVNQSGASRIELPGAAALSVLSGLKTRDQLSDAARTLNATTSEAIVLAGRRADAEKSAAGVAIEAAEKQLAVTREVAETQEHAATVFESSARRQERAATNLAGQLARIAESAAGGLVPQAGSAGASLGAGRFGVQSILGGFGPGGAAGFRTPGIVPGQTAGGGRGGFSLGNILSGFKGNFAGLREFAGLGNSIQLGAGRATTFQAASLGQKLTGFAGSDAALLAGIGLFANGLRQGGAKGIAQTTGGGALVGFKFGGPVGAAIGAAIGAGAGIARLFVKGAEEKAREKIRKVFGLDVRYKAVLEQVVGMARSNFGGDIDAAIRSPQGRDLLELFALHTGQTFTGFNASAVPVSFVQRGSGQIFQEAQFRNGRPIATQSSLPTIVPGGSAPGVTVLNLQLNGEATTAVMQGQAVQVIDKAPRLVAQANQRAAESNFGRKRTSALTLEPWALGK